MKFRISFLCRVVSTCILVLILTITFFNSFGTRLKSHYLAIASMQADKVASLVCLNSISSLIEEKYSQVDFIYDKDEILFNTYQLNTLMKDSVNTIYQEIKNVEQGESQYFDSKYGKGIIYEIPFHLFSDNVLYSSFGMKIPVKFSLVGDVKGKITTNIEEFGINNALININLLIDFSSRISVPLTSEIYSTEIEIPIYSKIFNGEIPNYFPYVGSVGEIYSSEIEI